MRKPTLNVAGVIAVVAGVFPAMAQVPDGMTPLLSPDLSGWHWSLTTHHGSTGKAVYEDGALYLSQEPYGQGGLFMTDRRYRNFELYLETDIPWGLNSGIFLRSTESGGAYQIELVPLAADSPAMTTVGALIGEGVAVATMQPSDLRPIWKAGWNSFRIRMTGDAPKVIIWVNGHQVLESQQPRNTKIAGETDGRIGLQLHWNATYEPQIAEASEGRSWKPGARIGFRNIAIKELP
jgi:Domain of Unknown Function (DUF1080)